MRVRLPPRPPKIMNEKIEGPKIESEQEKKERLRLILEWAIEQFHSVEKLEDAAVEITRKRKSGATETVETLPWLVVEEMDDEGILASGIDEDGEPTAAATMFWRELIDVKKMKEK
jgi:hypothetical protein